MAKIVAFLLLILTAILEIEADSRFDDEGIKMNEYYTGRKIKVSEAILGADAIVVGELLNQGEASPGAPGQAYYDGAIIAIRESLLGTLKNHVAFAYTRQTFPEASAEKACTVGGLYIFFLASVNKGAFRAIKILPASEHNVAKLQQILNPENEKKISG